MSDKTIYEIFATGHPIEKHFKDPDVAPFANELCEFLLREKDFESESLKTLDHYVGFKGIRHLTSMRIFPTIDHANELLDELKYFLDLAKQEEEEEEEEDNDQEDDDLDDDLDDDEENDDQEEEEEEEGDDQSDEGEQDEQEGEESEDSQGDDSQNQNSSDKSNGKSKSKKKKGNGKGKKNSKNSNSSNSKSKKGKSSSDQAGGSGKGSQKDSRSPSDKAAERARKRFDKILNKVIKNQAQQNKTSLDKLKQQIQEKSNQTSNGNTKKKKVENEDIPSKIMGADENKYTENSNYGFSADEVEKRNELYSQLRKMQLTADGRALLKVFGNLVQIMHKFRIDNEGDGPEEVVGVKFGNKVNQLTLQSKIPMASPSGDPEVDELLELLFLKKFASKSLLQFDKRSPQTRGLGDLYLTLDVSGSMGSRTKLFGEALANYQIGFMLALAIMLEMKKQNRRLIFTTFSDEPKLIFDSEVNDWYTCFKLTFNSMANCYMGGTQTGRVINHYLKYTQARKEHIDFMVITDMQDWVDVATLNALIDRKIDKHIFSWCLAFVGGQNLTTYSNHKDWVKAAKEWKTMNPPNYSSSQTIEIAFNGYTQTNDFENVIAFVEQAFVKQ